MRKHTDHKIFKVLPDFRFGDETAFAVLFYEFYPGLTYFGLQITGDRTAAQDIAEEAFIAAWKQRETIINLKGFLYRKVKNDSLNWLRAEKTRLARYADAGVTMEDADNSAWDALLKTELMRQLHSAISKLPPQRRKVFQMLYQEGLSVKQTAVALKLSVSAIKDHKRSGILFLRKLLPLLFIVLLNSW